MTWQRKNGNLKLLDGLTEEHKTHVLPDVHNVGDRWILLINRLFPLPLAALDLCCGMWGLSSPNQGLNPHSLHWKVYS